METIAASVHVTKDTTANPAPLGLLGFGMTTVLLNLHNAGLYPLDTMILGMGLFFGGMAQIFAGIMEWKKGNTFGTTAFTAYGLFWMSLVALLVFPAIGWGKAAGNVAMTAYLGIWGLFTAIMFVGLLNSTVPCSLFSERWRFSFSCWPWVTLLKARPLKLSRVLRGSFAVCWQCTPD